MKPEVHQPSDANRPFAGYSWQCSQSLVTSQEGMQPALQRILVEATGGPLGDSAYYQTGNDYRERI
jgi:hypothetical protein